MAKAGWRTGGSQKAFPPHLPPETEADRTPRGSLLACMTASREPSNQSFEVDREATVCFAGRRFFLLTSLCNRRHDQPWHRNIKGSVSTLCGTPASQRHREQDTPSQSRAGTRRPPLRATRKLSATAENE